MPNEYDAASAKPRPRDTPPPGLAEALPPAPASTGVGVPAWPTMIEETIGSIGSTHGVSDSSRPAMKKAPTIGQNEPLRSTASIVDDSVLGVAREVTTDVAAAVETDAAPGASRLAVPVPPNPVRPTAAALCIGG